MGNKDMLCQGACPFYRDCVLSGAVEHSLHICQDPRCACHCEERYAQVIDLVETDTVKDKEAT